jgi:hypothetical protein
VHEFATPGASAVGRRTQRNLWNAGIQAVAGLLGTTDQNQATKEVNGLLQSRSAIWTAFDALDKGANGNADGSVNLADIRGVGGRFSPSSTEAQIWNTFLNFIEQENAWGQAGDVDANLRGITLQDIGLGGRAAP